MTGFNQAALDLVIFLPLLGAAIMLLLPGRFEREHKIIALVATLLTCLFGIHLLLQFDYSNAAAGQFGTNHAWIPTLNSRYHVFIDGISLPLLTLSALTSTLCVIYSWSHLPEPRNAKGFLILMLMLETGVNGTFAAQDLLLFFVFFELVLLPMYFLIGIWGGERRDYASLKFFIYTVLGSAFMLLSFVALYFLGGHTFDIPQLAATGSAAGAIAHNTQLLIFAGLFIGFAIKVPMFPLHTWMTDAHTAAPTAASVMLAGVMLKLGAYGFIRIALPILPDAATSWAPAIGLLAVISIIYGALGCLAQTDLKRLIAFSSLSHMGFVMLAISTLTDFGINAALFAMVAHGLITAMLFFLAGSIQDRIHTRHLARFGGLLTKAPRLGWILGFCAFASFGMPGLAGFWGEFGSLLSSFSPADALPLVTFRTYFVIAAFGTLLATGYLLWMYARVAFGHATGAVEQQDVPDVNTVEYIAWAPLLVLIVVLGVYPAIVFDVTNPAVSQLVHRFGARP